MKVLEEAQVLKFALAVFFATILTFQIYQPGGYRSGILHSALAQPVTSEDANKTRPASCAAGQYLDYKDNCASLSECKQVDSGVSKGAYECPGASGLSIIML